MTTCKCRYAEKDAPEDDAREEGVRSAARDKLFDKGQSKRIWGELFKVVDSSDVVIQARGPSWQLVPCLFWGCAFAHGHADVHHGCPCLHVAGAAAGRQMAALTAWLILVLISSLTWDCSGVIEGGEWAQVLDARDPLGTRCRYLEHHLRKNARHKHLLLLLNKCDLVRPPPGTARLRICLPGCSIFMRQRACDDSTLSVPSELRGDDLHSLESR